MARWSKAEKLAFREAKKTARQRKSQESRIIPAETEVAVPTPKRQKQGKYNRGTPGKKYGMKSASNPYSVDPNVESDGFFSVLGQMGSQMGRNLMKEGGGDGWGIAKMIGKHALKGGVAGAAIGGTMEAAQGGSFWTGAKSGAFNGAVGWGAYRTLGKSVGATTRNPFGREGAFGKTMDMHNGMSKAAKVLIDQKAAAAANKAANGHT